MAKSRLFIVEDDVRINKNLALMLDRSGYEYTYINNGSTAVEYLKKDHDYDLALIGVLLPGIDGFTLIEHIKKYGIPVLYLTAKADVSSKIKGLRIGAEDYMTKPFSTMELMTRIEKILGRASARGKMLKYRDITVDVEQHTVTKNGAPVHLRPLEFDLFVTLLRHKNQILSREQLLNEIWGVDFMGVRTVDTHIAILRKKLGIRDGIVTIFKVGYCLEDES